MTTSRERTIRKGSAKLARGAIAWVLASVALSACIGIDEPPQATSPTVLERTVASGGHTRRYLIALPPSPHGRLPVVFVMHGMGGEARNALVTYGWSDLAIREGFIAVGLEALPLDHTAPADFRVNPRRWNAGAVNASVVLRGPGADDVSYFRDVLADLERNFSIDRDRLYATGMSNGAGMTNRLASETGVFAAIAPVAGNNWAVRAPSQPLSVMLVFGRADTLLPVNGGIVQLPWGEARQPAPKVSADRWASLLECAGSSTTREGALEWTIWTSCRAGSSVKMVMIDGQGHVWPGLRRAELPESLVGPTSSAYAATDQAWAFFKAHRRGR